MVTIRMRCFFRYYHAQPDPHAKPHLIGHYTAGARLEGMTPRQFKREMTKLFAEISAENESPYAQPIVNSLDTFFEEAQIKKKIKKKEKTDKTVSSIFSLSILK